MISQVLAMDLAAMASSIIENTVQQAQEGFNSDTLRASASDAREGDML